jgi:lysophospholipase
VIANSGLSGGSWLIGASAQNNYASIDTLRSQIWKTPQLIPNFTDFGFSYANMASDYARKNGKFPDLVSLVDIWSWFIGYGLISRGQSPSKTLFRDITTKAHYQSGNMPFPIVIVNQRASGDLYNAQDPDVPILEATPLEFGDWQSSRGFIAIDMYSIPLLD